MIDKGGMLVMTNSRKLIKVSKSQLKEDGEKKLAITNNLKLYQDLCRYATIL